MSRHSKERRRPRSRLRIFLFIFTALVLITLDARSDEGSLTKIRSFALDAIGPIRSASARVFVPIGNAWQGITSYEDLENRNAVLEAKLAEIKSSTLQIGEIERDREALLSLLGARDTLRNIPRRTARVIDAQISNFERTIELDKGSRDGIKVGMPVETGAGLIGRVSQVSVTRARVELLTDPNFDAGARLVRSGDDGVASGKGAGKNLIVNFIELETVVIPGETVVTSGFQGSTFPEGLLIGTVVDVTPNAVQDTQRITVYPSADLDRIRWVSVILFEADASGPVLVDRDFPEPSSESGIGAEQNGNDS